MGLIIKGKSLNTLKNYSVYFKIPLDKLKEMVTAARLKPIMLSGYACYDLTDIKKLIKDAQK